MKAQNDLDDSASALEALKGFIVARPIENIDAIELEPASRRQSSTSSSGLIATFAADYLGAAL